MYVLMVVHCVYVCVYMHVVTRDNGVFCKFTCVLKTACVCGVVEYVMVISQQLENYVKTIWYPLFQTADMASHLITEQLAMVFVFLFPTAQYPA